MQPFLLIAIGAMLAGQASCALADTMYKCVGANGKVTYASLPCDTRAREARQFAVPAPESEQESGARLRLERDRLRMADLQFRMRQGERNAGYGGGRTYVANPPSGAAQQRQAQQDKTASERAEAARLNAARIGNCTVRRLEAGCL